MKTFAIAPEGVEEKVSYLTSGKEYEIISQNAGMFKIQTDDGFECYCVHENCAHLPKGKNWTIITKD